MTYDTDFLNIEISQELKMIYRGISVYLCTNNALKMPYWDITSYNLANESASRKHIIQKLDPETIIHLLLEKDPIDYQQILNEVGMTKRDILSMLKKMLEKSVDDYFFLYFII